MPWMKGRRPAWLIRLGLFLYDHLGGRKILPGTATLDLSEAPEGAPLQDRFREAYEYSDCWVEDSRLVVLNARDAEARGAEILTRTKVVSAERRAASGIVTLEDTETGGGRDHAPGCWSTPAAPGSATSSAAPCARRTRRERPAGARQPYRDPRLFDHDKCYFFQGTDGRIIFAIPYETDFTLIGTTDQEHTDPGEAGLHTRGTRLPAAPSQPVFQAPGDRDDVVWTYSGVRPLYDDGASSATAATRDYVLKVDADAAARRCSMSSAARSPPTGGWPKARWRRSRRLSRRPASPGPRACHCPAAISRSTASSARDRLPPLSVPRPTGWARGWCAPMAPRPDEILGEAQRRPISASPSARR
jgi:glycerol-3-phosphate dehydrogenase